jgi:cellulose synthase/poly-beta-1,6-N-acetylglucosamine synthase-like glycosyltransferase
LLHVLKVRIKLAWTRLPELLRLRRRWRRRHLLSCISFRSNSFIIASFFLIIWERSKRPGEESNLILERLKGSVSYLTTPLKSGLSLDESHAV